MGHRPRHPIPHRHRRGKACQRCIFDLEVELGYRQYPPPPPPSRTGEQARDCQHGRGWCPNCIDMLQ